MSKFSFVFITVLALVGCNKKSPSNQAVGNAPVTQLTSLAATTNSIITPAPSAAPTPPMSECKVSMDTPSLKVGQTATLSIACTYSSKAVITDSSGKQTKMDLVDGAASMPVTAATAGTMSFETIIYDDNHPGTKVAIPLTSLTFVRPNDIVLPPSLTPNDCTFALSSNKVRVGESTNVQIHCAVAVNVIIASSAGLNKAVNFDANGDVALPVQSLTTHGKNSELTTFYAVAYAADGTAANLGALNLETVSTAPVGCVFALQPNVIRLGENTNVVAHCDVGQVVQFDGPSGWHQVRYLDANGNASVPWQGQTSWGLAQLAFSFYGTVYGERGEGLSLGGLNVTVLNDTPSDCAFRLEPSSANIGQTINVVIDCQNAASVTFDGPSGWHTVATGSNHFSVPYLVQSTTGLPSLQFSFYATPYGYTGKTLKTFATNLTAIDPAQYIPPQAATRGLYRQNDGINHIDTSFDIVGGAGMVIRGFSNQLSNTHPLYACQVQYFSGFAYLGQPIYRTDHYVSVAFDPTYCSPNPLIYLLNSNQAGSTPLYRCYKSAPGFNDHFTTTNPNSECTPNGYAIEGIVGYGF